MISFIVAIDKERAIGKEGALPWRLPADLRRFRKLTMGHPIIMGRKTFESIGRALPGRKNIVLTRQSDFSFDGVVVVHSREDALKEAFADRVDEEVFVIGGAVIFNEFFDVADKIYLTSIDHLFSGDTFFPEFEANFDMISEERYAPDDENRYGYAYRTYTRKEKDE